MRKKMWWSLAGAAVAILAVSVCFLLGHRPISANISPASGSSLRVVAAENFYGDIAEQIGGDRVVVTSILNNPNADPHEYESSVPDAIAVSDANLVIENGLNYDSWMDKLLAASPNPNRLVVTAGKVAPLILPNNPHVWYDINNIQAIATAIAADLTRIDPADETFFYGNLQKFVVSLQPLSNSIAEIKASYSGTPIGLTETIFQYQAEPAGLNIVTPLSFQEAVAEGNDPAAQDVAKINQQITNKEIKVLIYNSQTITPFTSNLEETARKQGLPLLAVSEIMPKGAHYQIWMQSQLVALLRALAATKN